jgi:hypothetical protein
MEETTEAIVEAAPVNARKPQKRLTDEQWKRARLLYETTRKLTLLQVAQINDVGPRSVERRASREGWRKRSEIVDGLNGRVADAVGQHVESAIQESAKAAAQNVIDELQPFIEAEKRDHVKRMVTRAKRSFTRYDRLYDKLDETDDTLSPKDEAFMARAEDMNDGIVRRALGMSDSLNPSAPLNVGVLIGGNAAVQIVQGSASTSPPPPAPSASTRNHDHREIIDASNGNS